MSAPPKRTIRILAPTALVALLTLSLVSGCSPAQTTEPSAGGGMGMAGDSQGYRPGGVIAEARNATFTVEPVQESARGVVVESVTAPTDGWLLVRSASASGAVLGARWVPAGTSNRLVIPLTAAATADARLALHVDRGKRHSLEFDPASPQFQRDAPVYADDRAVQADIELANFGAEVAANSALIMVEDQKLRGGELVVRYLLVPTASWVSVSEAHDGALGRLVGAIQRPAGEWQEVHIALARRTRPGDYIVTVHQDAGRAGEFEFDHTAPLSSPDAPYRAAGVVVSQEIRLR